MGDAALQHQGAVPPSHNGNNVAIALFTWVNSVTSSIRQALNMFTPGAGANGTATASQTSGPSTVFGVPFPRVSLDAVGLVALADLTTIARRTALTGTSTLLDAFILCPGIHRQQYAPELNGGEYPAVAAMTTGYVFRIENPATVHYLQKVGRPGQLTTLSVSRVSGSPQSTLSRFLDLFYVVQNTSLVSSLAYFAAAFLTTAALFLLTISRDGWGVVIFMLLMFARVCNIFVIRRRSQVGWKGASEPGVRGDLLVLLSQDRWIRMQGPVDDLKTVTSGQWQREMRFWESSITAVATILVYLDAALASNMEQAGKVILLALLISSAGLLAIANHHTEVLSMHGNVIQVRDRRPYARRLDLARELIKQSGRDDWALRLGMIVPTPKDRAVKIESPRDEDGVTM